MMDWNSVVDQFDPLTCVLSVEKKPDGGYGKIRIVTGNPEYIDSLALAAGGVGLDSDKKIEFVPNSEYTRYIPKDLNFEDVCYRCAVLKKPIQNVVHMPRYPFDMTVFLMPMRYEDDNIAYCTFSQILTPKSESNLMSKHISLETAIDVIGTCVKLRGSRHFHDNIGDVLDDIRTMCGADRCCAIVLNDNTRSCSVLGESRSPDSNRPWMRSIMDDNFYEMASKWLDLIGGSFCLAITDKHDMEYLHEQSPEWYESLVSSGVESLVIFPIISEDHLFGYIWATNFNTDNTDHIKDTLELTSAFIASELSGERFADQEPSGGDGRYKMDHIVTGLHDDMNQHLSHMNDQANSMITAMASDYRSVYYVDLDRNDAVCYRADHVDKYQTPQGQHFPYIEWFTWYANNIVTESYRNDFLSFIDPDNIRNSLADQPIIAYRYLANRDGHEYYEMIRMAGVRRAEDREDHMVHAIGLGFTDIDSEMRESMAKNEALIEALDIAEEASRAKTAFLSNMSHEIRTPMNAIIGLDKLALGDEDISDRTREYLEKIGESASHLLDLINDILDMSRIESGHIVLRREEFSFRSMLEQINLMVMSQCSDKGLEYECRVLSHVDEFYIGDDMKLKEVLINILSNAIKFTEAPGSVKLTVEKTAEFDDQSTLKFCICDTGIGMDKEFIPKIFDTFSQEDSSRTNKYGSTGLGMAITKGIVEMMNGTIHVESEKGVGTEFTVMVTLRNSKRTAADDVDEVNINDIRALVVDDDPIAAEHARMTLDERGIRADVAGGGKEALRMMNVQHAKNEPYNLVLMDWKMPEMGGVDTTEAVRELYNNDSTIIILTAYDREEVMGEAEKAGADSVLTKPLSINAVLTEFERIARRNNLSCFKEKKRADLEGRRVLLAEDIEINAEIMMDILSMEDIEADHAENGRIAVELFQKSELGEYSAILMDVRMPEMDGLEAAEMIRSLDREDAKRIPIIALTANAFDEDVQRSMQAGMNSHLSKPVDSELLFQTMGELIYEAEAKA